MPSDGNESSATVCLNKNAVNTTRIREWEAELIAAGAKTLMFLSIENIRENPKITIPKPDNGELYITFTYCTAHL